MQDDGGSVATGSIRDEVVEVALQGPHEALVTRKDLGGEAAVATPLNLLQIGGLEAGLRIPQVNVVLALVAEEQGGAPVGAQENCLFTVGLGTHIDDGARSLAHPEVLSLNGVQSRGTQVAEEQGGGAIRLGGERHIEHIAGGGGGLGQDNAVGLVAGDVVHQDAACPGISHIAARDRK